jgi:1-acyl-sn-glycerol-3-phosphate acyltransferase
MRRLARHAREVARWARRGRAFFPLADAIQLLSPPVLMGRFAWYALKRGTRAVPAGDPAARDPAFLGWLLALVRVLARAFRLEVRGVENVPAAGAALLVGNHNGGLVPTDLLFTLLAIWDRFGASRAVTVLAHDFLLDDDLFRRYLVRLGAVRAGPEGARRALAAGNLVLVYPGGDVEVFRPYREAGRIELDGRKGFVELALRERVPIIPVVSAGTHEQFVVLTRGDRIARALRLHSIARADVFPIVLSIPWGLTSGYLPYLPFPARTTVAFGEPIAWPGLAASGAEDPEVVARCFDVVKRRMQAMLDGLYEQRRSRLASGVPKPAQLHSP